MPIPLPHFRPPRPLQAAIWSLSPLPLPLLWSGCLSAGTYPLAPLTAETPHSVSAAQLDYDPSRGWDLTVALTLRNPDPDQNRRYDLSSVWVRADGGAWEPCQHPDDVDQDLLIFVLAPGEERQRAVRCQGVARPDRELEVRFAVTHAGEGRGVEILRYGGVVVQ